MKECSLDLFLLGAARLFCFLWEGGGVWVFFQIDETGFT